MSSSEPNSNGVEVDGILFETLMPVQTIYLPQVGEHVPVQFGVRITNQSSTPYRFNLPGFVPRMFDENGQTMRTRGGSNARRRIRIEDIPLISPGASLTFWMSFTLNWMRSNCFGFRGYDLYGGVWEFLDFQPGTYQFRFTYNNHSPQPTVPLDTGRTEARDFWAGTVSTPLSQFHLVQP